MSVWNFSPHQLQQLKSLVEGIADTKQPIPSSEPTPYQFGDHPQSIHSAAQNKIATLKIIVDNILAQLQHCLEIKQSVEEENRHLHSTLEEVQNHIMQLKDENDAFRSYINGLEDRVDSLSREKLTLELQNKQFYDECTEFASENQLLSSETTTLKKQLSDFLEQSNHKHIDLIHEDISLLKGQLQQLQTELSAEQQKNHLLSQELELMEISLHEQRSKPITPQQQENVEEVSQILKHKSSLKEEIQMEEVDMLNISAFTTNSRIQTKRGEKKTKFNTEKHMPQPRERFTNKILEKKQHLIRNKFN